MKHSVSTILVHAAKELECIQNSRLRVVKTLETAGLCDFPQNWAILRIAMRKLKSPKLCGKLCERIWEMAMYNACAYYVKQAEEFGTRYIKAQPKGILFRFP